MNVRKALKVVLILCAAAHFGAAQKYFGTHISRLSELHHAVSGDVYAVDSRTIFIKGLNYDGEGPAAYFYVGTSGKPSNIGGFRIRDERGSNGVLKRYRNKDITLTLPEGKTLRDIKWFSIWCDEFSVDFGNVMIPKNLDFPRPQKIGGLRGIHAVQSDNIVIVDAQTLLIPNFSYDGAAPDAKFWVGRGQKPSANGIKIADENGKETPLRKYDRKTIVLTLPGDLTVFDIGYFGVWCEAFTVDFGHAKIPEQVKVPPSLKMLGISPQSKLNCEVLHDELAFEVRWAVAGESVVIQLVSKLQDNEYMSFGVSADTENSVMVGGDVVVAWVNRLTGKGYAQDYFLDSKSQCSGNRGSCPDTRIKDNTNSIRLLNAAIVNDYSIVTYQRPLKSADAYDQAIFANKSQAIIWAIGPLNQRYEVSYHSQFLKKNKFIDFGRQPFWNCPIPENDGKPLLAEAEDDHTRPQSQKLNQQNTSNRKSSNERIDTQRRPAATTTTTIRPVPTPKAAPKKNAWEIPPIQCHEPEDGVFYAQMGPTGGKRGYPAITGHVGWGISWYINGLLIPEINVVRGKTYTFVVEGGNDADTPAKYHPFYITDDSVGGFEHKSEEEREKIKIFAGVHRSRNGKVTPTGLGRICNWTPDQKGPEADEYSSFGAYQRSLTLKCDEGEPGIITWTPDENTPDTVYYQCFTHRYLGWKINVMDSCDGQPQASSRQEVYVEADIEAEPSIKHETKLFPSENFLQHHDKDLIKHHNMNSQPPRVTVELQKSGEFNKLITEGIRTAEALEESILLDQKLNRTRPLPPTYITHEENLEEDPELIEAIKKIPSIDVKQNYKQRQPQRPPPRPQYTTSSGLPAYLRPPQNVNLPFYRPVKLAQRRPIAVERRPVSNQRPYLLPQQSIMMNHYKKPIHSGPPPMGVRNHMKSKMPPIPQKQMAPVLLLGEPTEIKPFRKSSDIVIGKPSKSQIDVSQAFKSKKEPPRVLKYQQKKIEKNFVRGSPPPSPFKDPFDVKNDSIPLREASNTGFKAETIIVESGFKPIFRREDIVHREDDSDEIEERISASIQKISRRSDDFAIADAIESDINNDEPQSNYFEPMFIPSPRDSIALPLVNVSDGQGVDVMVAEASDRQEFFYLPPNDSKRSAAAYDAKAVLDTSLLNDPSPSQNNFVKLSSKTKQFIKDTPQFTPFLGEIPSELMLQLSASRIADTSSPVIKAKSSSVISTKLSAVQTNNASRRKREAHEGHDHHHEHNFNSAQQLSSTIAVSLSCAFLVIKLFV